MEKHSTRYFLLFALVLIGLFLINAWQQEQANKLSPSNYNVPVINKASENDIPAIKAEGQNRITSPEITDPNTLIDISTNIFKAKISRVGGDILYLELKNYPEKYQSKTGFILLDESPARYYIAQSGLLSEDGPDSKSLGRATYKVNTNSFVFEQSGTSLDLFYTTKSGVEITKSLIFNDDYTIKVKYLINNLSSSPYQANIYGRIKRKPELQSSGGFMGSMKTYTGAAVTTPSTKYKKISFDDMRKKPFQETIIGGWAAMVEHYFTVAWIPPEDSSNFYQSEIVGNDIYSINYVGEPITVAAGDSQEVYSVFYAGPEITEKLKQISPGLELTVDYGFFWFLSYPLFIALKYIYSLVGNWGLAIIIITFGIKLLFYPLSSASYRSMGNMRKVQPKIEELKKQFGEDKQQFGQAVMQLYKREKVNPLGGCLPIIIQIPVFISLYYVLLESVELRLAPFMWWIQDLSAKDPYYILPIIMGASMLIQQRLNPAPADPIQAKVMMFMPIFFTFLFLQFPSGLVLYWVVNNVLSIIQQWVITRKIIR